MNDYTGKICPYCKTGFQSDDDVIVCSECDMPHHKECWIENQGCTTFGCLGTMKAADSAITSVTTTQMNYDDSNSVSTGGIVFCTQCGTQNASSHSFCSHCGNKLTAVSYCAQQSSVYVQANSANTNPYSYVNPQNENHSQSNYLSERYNTYQPYQKIDTDADLQLLVGKKTEYYMPKFQIMKSQKKSASWNWSAFLVAPYWMIYRKMYGYGVAVLAVDIIISLFGSGFLALLMLGGYITLGILGNSIYRKYLENKVNQVKSMSEPYKAQFLTTNGGVNTAAAILTFVGRVLLVTILMA